ncbi:hypothetical protein [Nitrobacter sp. TKz-YC02]|uniref:hypothetical protein n=1 Tax=Nitrobacter sp. TKz-YC02 TaxID=3398704 RepID=UPI003CF61462
MADSRHTTKPSAAPHRGHSQTTSDDPVVAIARDIQRLWDAHAGAEVEKSNAQISDGMILSERCTQLTEWRSSLELVGTYTVASSMPGAVIQIAWAMHELRSLADTLEGCQAGESEPCLNDYVDRIRRLVKSAADVMVADLGKDYEPIRPIVETYAHLGDRGPNWLTHKVDKWADQAEVERASA